VTLPVKRPTACTFGGEQLEHLYITTRVETGGWQQYQQYHGNTLLPPWQARQGCRQRICSSAETDIGRSCERTA
jgi:sugar lactone lactonase YvrE